ncbi:MAG: LytR/AlgR family response regulator transcription factor [Chloroflexota bacterium]
MSQKLSALIVDDEESARKLLDNLLKDLQCFTEIRTAKSAAAADLELAGYDPDLIFVDIKMPGRDGFSFINDLPIKDVKPGIVFVTAYDQFAIKAIKNHAFDYLLKPVDRKELKLCVQKFLENRQPASKENQDKFLRIRIKTRNGTAFVNPSNVVYCKADGNYTEICTGEKVLFCSVNLGRIYELLSGYNFFRVGRSHIINREFITLIDRKECFVVLTREDETVNLKIPRHHLKDLDNI